jgi:hypothetical protein
VSIALVQTLLLSSLAALVLLWLVLEALTLADWIPQNHITPIVRKAYRKEPGVFVLLAFILGYLFGHFFWCSCS